MKYNNDNVRRQDRLLAEDEACELLRTGEYGVLSMVDDTECGARAYGLPVNYVWDGDKTLYIHCAKEGRKLRCIAQNACVSFCVVGRHMSCQTSLPQPTRALYWNVGLKRAYPKTNDARHCG